VPRQIPKMGPTFPLLALGLVLGLVGGAWADVAKWDSARTTEIATNLEQATASLYEAIYHQPTAAGPGAAQWHEMRDTVRRMRMEAKHLSDELMKGKDQAHTRGAWRQMTEWLRDIEEASRQTMLGNEVLTKLSAVEDLLRQLAPYYDSDWDKGSAGK
jgi:hypothetical protein